jgi:hypothetical protein
VLQSELVSVVRGNVCADRIAVIQHHGRPGRCQLDHLRVLQCFCVDAVRVTQEGPHPIEIVDGVIQNLDAQNAMKKRPEMPRV